MVGSNLVFYKMSKPNDAENFQKVGIVSTYIKDIWIVPYFNITWNLENHWEGNTT